MSFKAALLANILVFFGFCIIIFWFPKDEIYDGNVNYITMYPIGATLSRYALSWLPVFLHASLKSFVIIFCANLFSRLTRKGNYRLACIAAVLATFFALISWYDISDSRGTNFYNYKTPLFDPTLTYEYAVAFENWLIFLAFACAIAHKMLSKFDII